MTRGRKLVGDGSAGSAAASDVETGRLSYAQNHATAEAASSGDFVLSVRPVEPLGDSQSSGRTYNPEPDEVVAEVKGADLMEAEGDRRYALVATLCGQSHGLRGTIEQVLNQLGVDLVYHLRLPNYRHDRPDELLRWLSRAATIGGRKGQYVAHQLR